MDIKQKKKILFHLAQKAETESAAMKAIQKECAKIVAVLESETLYDHIHDQLELLDKISYRVHEETVRVIRIFLERLKSLDLTYEEIPGYSKEKLSEYQNNFTLMVKALEVLENIRFHQPDEILDIFFEYSCHTEESVAKQATHGIEELAEYDLDIFYGDGKDWAGLGWEPQEKVINKIDSFDEKQKQQYYSAIIVACKKILSPTMTGTSATYKTFTWRSSAVPAKDGVKQVRNKALGELEKLYALAINLEQKKSVLNAMQTATDTHHMGEYGDDVLAMIIENTIYVIKFMKSIVVFDDMQLMQKIEHDAYWMLYHRGTLDPIIHKVALEIRDALYANEEYQMFRILIGFEGIFHDWEKEGKDREDIDREKEFREAEAYKMADTINAYSYNEWKDRIVQYAGIKSNDMATFPYFGKFLERFGKTSPDLALQLLKEATDQLENFFTAMLCGVAETESKGDAYSLLEGWCDEGKYLFAISRFFEYAPEVNEELLKKVLDKAVTNSDLNTLNQIISSVSAQYNQENRYLMRKFIVPALEKLTAHKNSGWIFSFWFRRQSGDILADMKTSDHGLILDNLIWLQDIDYDAEEILTAIAKLSPELVIQFFCKRLLKKGDEDENGRYEAFPYSFHNLSEPLSNHPVQAIDAVKEIYDGNSELFVYQGARLLSNIFPGFPPEFQQKLLEIVQTKDDENLLFVIAILRNYEGKPIIHNVCQEIVKILPDGSDLTNQLYITLYSTGVVSGEYGFVEAFKQKIEEMQPWLQDENEKIKEFALNYIVNLEKRIEFEKQRADEDITLRKHEYGSNEE
jgi:hypothetical protein